MSEPIKRWTLRDLCYIYDAGPEEYDSNKYVSAEDHDKAVARMKSAISTALGHSNCYCEVCKGMALENYRLPDEAIAERDREIASLKKALDFQKSIFREQTDDLLEAVRYLREGKRQFTPNTTNSHVDTFLRKFDPPKAKEETFNLHGIEIVADKNLKEGEWYLRPKGTT